MRNENDVTIACSIRYYRMRNGMTLRQLAEKSGCSLQYIGEIERSEKSVPYEKCNAIFSAMNMIFDYSDESAINEKRKLNEFIMNLYDQNFSYFKNKNDFEMDEKCSSYGFLYSVLRYCAYELLVKGSDDETIFLEESVGDILYYSGGITGSFFSLLMSCLYLERGDIELSLKYILHALDLSENDSYVEAILHMQYSAVLQKKKLYLSAVEESRSALEISKDRYYFVLSALINMNLGIIAGIMNMYEESLHYFNDAIEIAGQLKKTDLIRKIELNKMQVLYLNGRQAEALKTAEMYANKGSDESCFLLFLNDFLHVEKGKSGYLNKALHAKDTNIALLSEHIASGQFGIYEKDCTVLKKIESDVWLTRIYVNLLIKTYQKKGQYQNIGLLVIEQHILLS